MYSVVYMKDSGPYHVWLIAGPVKTLVEAKAKRSTSGDIVINSDTGQIVDSPEWLWDWEKSQPNCYAQRMRREQGLRVLPNDKL